jgi:hypothetical protein
LNVERTGSELVEPVLVWVNGTDYTLAAMASVKIGTMLAVKPDGV